MLHLKPKLKPPQPKPDAVAVYDQGTMLGPGRAQAGKLKKMILKREKYRKLLIVNGGGYRRRMLRNFR